MSKLQSLTEGFSRAVARFEDALAQEKTEYLRDSSIQRFEFCFDLSWKLVKLFLDEKHGSTCASPKLCFREAYRLALIPYDEFWLEMADIRNKTSHTYNEEVAEEVYKTLPKAMEYFKILREAVVKQKE